MTNKEFIKEYGVREIFDIIDSMYIRLSLLRIKKKIGGFRINKKRKVVIFYYKGKVLSYEVAKIYSMSDNKLVLLLEEEILKGGD